MKQVLLLIAAACVLTAQPLYNRTGQTGLWNSHSAITGEHTRFSGSLNLSYAEHAEYLTDITGVDGEEVCAECDPEYTRSSFDLSVGYGLLSNLDVALSVPLYLDWIKTVRMCHPTEERGFFWPGSENAIGVGDLRLSFSASMPRHFYTFGYLAAFTFPTGSEYNGYFPAKTYYQRPDGAVEGFYTSEMFEIENHFLMTMNFQEIYSELPLKAHVNAGVRIPLRIDTLDQTLPLAVGVEYRPLQWLDLFTEFTMEPRITSFGTKRSLRDDPMTVTPGVAVHTKTGVTAKIGTSISLSKSDGFMYAHSAVVNPEPAQVIVETAPQPRLSLIASVNWSAVLRKDRDGDGFYDHRDNCPEEKEDFDMFQDLDGCPEYDNDGDFIPDTLDFCVGFRETVNNYNDDDGCPDFNPAIDSNGADIRYDITFDYAKATLKPESFVMLDTIAAVMNEWSEIAVHVAGLVDSTGSILHNRKLSKNRAEAVKTYLVNRGIDQERISTSGHDAPVSSKHPVEITVVEKKKEIPQEELPDIPTKEIVPKQNSDKKDWFSDGDDDW